MKVESRIIRDCFAENPRTQDSSDVLNTKHTQTTNAYCWEAVRLITCVLEYNIGVVKEAVRRTESKDRRSD